MKILYQVELSNKSLSAFMGKTAFTVASKFDSKADMNDLCSKTLQRTRHYSSALRYERRGRLLLLFLFQYVITQTQSTLLKCAVRLAQNDHKIPVRSKG